MTASWQIWIDTGGTFTDCIAIDPEGRTRVCKVLSSGALRDRVEEVDIDGRVHLRGGAGLPDGTRIRLEIEGREPRDLVLAGGRGGLADPEGDPGATFALDPVVLQ